MRTFASKQRGKQTGARCLYLRAYNQTLFSFRCLTNIATGDHKQTGSVLCAVPYMIEILSSSLAGATALRRDSVELLEQICWAIGNIAGDCDEYRNILINNGCLPAVLAFLESSVADSVRGLGAVKNVGTPVDERPSSAAQTAAWALSNLSRGKVSGHLFFDTGKVPFLLGLMNGQAKGLSEEVWWLFTFLTAKDDDVVNALLELGIVQVTLHFFANMTIGCLLKIRQLLQRIGEALVACNGDSVSSIPLIRCAGNLSSGEKLLHCTNIHISSRSVLLFANNVPNRLLSGPDVWTDRLVADSRVLDALLVLTAYSEGAQWADQTASARKTVAKVGTSQRYYLNASLSFNLVGYFILAGVSVGREQHSGGLGGAAHAFRSPPQLRYMFSST